MPFWIYNVQETRDNTKEASGYLASLSRKTFSNAICLWIVIFLPYYKKI